MDHRTRSTGSHPVQDAAWVAVLLLALALVLGWGRPAQAAPGAVTQHEYQVFSDAKRRIGSGNFTRAAEILEGYFKGRRQGHSYGYELYGFALLQLDRVAEAARVLQEGVAAHPDNATIAQNLGAALARQDRYAEAAQAFLTAYRLGEEKSVGLAHSAAVFLLRAREYARAEAVLEPLVRRDDARVEWFVLLAQAQVRQDRTGPAAQILREAVARFPEDARLWRMLGFVYHKRGEQERAVAAAQIVHELEPTSADETVRLASLYCALGAPNLGERTVRDTQASPQFLDSLAHGLARSGDTDGALARMEEALRLEPTDERRVRKARLLLLAHRNDEARRVLTPLAQAQGPWQGRALWMLGMAAWSEGKWRAAEAALRKAVQADPRMERRARNLLAVMETVAGAEPEGR